MHGITCLFSSPPPPPRPRTSSPPPFRSLTTLSLPPIRSSRLWRMMPSWLTLRRSCSTKSRYRRSLHQLNHTLCHIHPLYCHHHHYYYHHHHQPPLPSIIIIFITIHGFNNLMLTCVGVHTYYVYKCLRYRSCSNWQLLCIPMGTNDLLAGRGASKAIFSQGCQKLKLNQLNLPTPAANYISSVESQKGAITTQRCSVENQEGAITTPKDVPLRTRRVLSS